MSNIIGIRAKQTEFMLSEAIAQVVDQYMRRGGYRAEYRARAIEMAHEATKGFAAADLQVPMTIPISLSEEQAKTLQEALNSGMVDYHRRMLAPVVGQAVAYSLLRLSIEDQAEAHGLRLVNRQDAVTR
jgi:hypothetical protein